MDGNIIYLVEKGRNEYEKIELTISNKLNFDDLLKIVSRKFGFEAKCLYTKEGSTIDDVNDIKKGEILYVTQGEPFYDIAKMPIKTGLNLMKIALIGSNNTGKTSLITRYTQKIFIDEYIPTYENIIRKTVKLKKESIFLDIMDTSGTEEFTSVQTQWYKDNEGFILVYDITKPKTFDALGERYKNLCDCRGDIKFPIFVIGSKSDMKRVVKIEDAKKFAAKIQAKYFEASAKTNTNVEEIFELMIKEIYELKHPIEKKESKCVII